MTFNLVMNSNNVIAGSNNSRYSYTFINNNLTLLDEAEICISNITLPYSFYNVTIAYNNRSFNLYFPTGAGETLFNILLPDQCFMTVTDINAYMQQQMILNGLYLINPQGKYVYYATFLYNPTTYGVQLICQTVPTSLPSGSWTQPTSWIGYPTTSRTPRINIPSTNNFGKIIGFVAGNYPNTASLTDRSFLNTLVPLGSNINSIIITCNLIDNAVGFPSNILDTMPISNTTFGSNLNYSPPALKWVKMVSGTYQKMEIQFVDQNLNAMNIIDNNVCISLLIKNKGTPITELFINTEETSRSFMKELNFKL
jgi:hypothetical protein